MPKVSTYIIENIDTESEVGKVVIESEKPFKYRLETEDENLKDLFRKDIQGGEGSVLGGELQIRLKNFTVNSYEWLKCLLGELHYFGYIALPVEERRR